MANRDIIVVGASAGGVEAVSALAAALPPDLPAAVFVTLHFPPQGISVLPRILSRAGRLPAQHGENGEPIEHGRIYIAPPDRHLLIYRNGIRLVRGPTENGNRPAIDPMFRSAAVAFGPRVIGVVLTGNLDDGTAGLVSIKRRHGLAIVQDPADAVFPSMPRSAIANARVDHVATLADLPALLTRLTREPISAAMAQPDLESPDVRETAYSAFDLEMIETPERHPGAPSSYACPDCGGVLWQIKDGDLVRYRCRVGHGWSAEGLIERQQNTLEAALWSALRALEESASLSQQMAGRFEKRGAESLARRYRDSANLALERAELIRSAITSGQPSPTSREDAEPSPEIRAAAGGTG